MLSLFMQVILQDRKNSIILSVRDVASRYLSAFIAAIYDISVSVANEQNCYLFSCKEFCKTGRI
jgi:hypothetical protein